MQNLIPLDGKLAAHRQIKLIHLLNINPHAIYTKNLRLVTWGIFLFLSTAVVGSCATAAGIKWARLGWSDHLGFTISTNASESLAECAGNVPYRIVAPYTFRNYSGVQLTWPKTNMGAVCLMVFEAPRFDPFNTGDDDFNEGGGDNCPAGHPGPGKVNGATGNQFLSQTDYKGTPAGKLSFKRYYNSNNHNINNGPLGPNWRSNYDRQLQLLDNDANVAGLFRPDGKIYVFSKVNSTWEAQPGFTHQLEERYENSVMTGWRYITSNRLSEEYDINGRLQTITEQQDITSLQYGSNNRLEVVKDAFDRELQLAYDSQGRISSVTGPAGGSYHYHYDTRGRLERVTYPDGNTDPNDNPEKNYHYENNTYLNALTGISDEHGQRMANWNYDANGRVVSSEDANGANAVQFSYIRTSNEHSVRQNEAGGAQRKIYFKDNVGFFKPQTVEGGSCSQCSGLQTINYNSQGRVDSRTDWNGHTTQYAYNTRGLEILRTEAAGTPEQRSIRTEWHPDFAQPVRIIEPRQTREFTYDTHGNLIAETLIDTTLTPNTQRTTHYTYNDQGRLIRIDGPRSDVQDITRYEYDAAGNRIKMIDALGFETLIDRHDAHGNPLRIIDANGSITELEYNTRQQITRRTQAAGTAEAAETRFEYDSAGRLIKITQPDSGYQVYTYDTTGRLTAITDHQGQRMEYTLDAMGNRIQTQTRYAAGWLFKTQSALFNSQGRLTQMRGAQNQTTQYEYDANGNTTRITDPNHHSTLQGFDALNRLIRVIDPENGATAPTRYQYDSQDNLTEVMDPRGLQTHYQYNGFGELIRQHSPDSGVTTYTYDAAGNRISQTDARGMTVAYIYDALNRLTLIDHPGTGDDILYHYDNGNKGKHRLTRIQDTSGSTDYQYDRRGNITHMQITPAGLSYRFTLQYTYTKNDQPGSIVYPSGRTFNLSHHTSGQVAAIDMQYNNKMQTLVQDLSYKPFGPLDRLYYYTENNPYLLRTLDYDLDGRITSIFSGHEGLLIQWVDYAYDPAGNISQVSNLLDTSRSQSVAYDGLNRLTQVQKPTLQQDYQYDAVGNRTRLGESGQETLYTYATDNQQLLATSGARTARYHYDVAGNTTAIDNTLFSYNPANRLAAINRAGQLTQAVYNAQGQRVKKIAPKGNSTHFIYDVQGQLIAEADTHGQIRREYIYLHGEPLALMENNQVYYYFNDHLGTPQRMVDIDQQTVWQADYDVFGSAQVTVNTVENNLRFAGQYFDQETGLHYNYFRYYDPKIGRYLTADPISVGEHVQKWMDRRSTAQLLSQSRNQLTALGGSSNLTSIGSMPPLELNPYVYVLNNPLRYIDPFGLATCGHYPPGSTLRKICENSPGDEGKLECVRKCLRDALPPGDNNPNICEHPDWYFEDHPVCWWECDYIPWPY